MVSSKLYRIAAGVALIALLTIFVVFQFFGSAEGNNYSLQRQWVEAEALTDPAQAVAAWNVIASGIAEGSAIDTGITAIDAQAILFNSKINAAMFGDPASFQAAQEQANKGTPQERFWKLIQLSYKMAAGASQLAWKSLKLAESVLAEMPDSYNKSYAIHALASTALSTDSNKALVFTWNGLDLATRWMPFIASPEHRAELMHRVALYSPLPDDKWQSVLAQTLRFPLNKGKQRKKTLTEIYEKARKGRLNTLAMDALSGIMDDPFQQKLFWTWFEDEMEQNNEALAVALAQRIGDGRYAAPAWGQLAVYYTKQGQTERAKDARNRSHYLAVATRGDDRRARALAEAVRYSAESGDAALASQIFASTDSVMNDEKSGQKALAALIKSAAEDGNIAQAQEYLATFATDDAKLLSKTVSSVAKALAESSDPDGALKLLNQKLQESSHLNKARYAIVKAFAGQERYSEAEAVSNTINDGPLRAKAKSLILHQKQSNGTTDATTLSAGIAALEQIIRELPSDQRDEAYVESATFLSAFHSGVQAWPNLVKNPASRDQLYATLVEQSTTEDDWDAVNRTIATIKTSQHRDTAIAVTAHSLAKKKNGKQAAYFLRQMVDAKRRAKEFRKLAENMAQQTDYYGKLGSTEADRFLNPLGADTNSDSHKASAATTGDEASGFTVASLSAPELGKTLPAFAFPERLSYNTEHVVASLPMVTPFVVQAVHYKNSYFINSKLMSSIGNAIANVQSDEIAPTVIYLERGVASIPLLYEQLNGMGFRGYIIKQGKNYTLRRGLVIGPEATLIVDGGEVDNLYLSHEYSGVIANVGKLYITDTRVAGWRESTQKPTYANYEDRYHFRPFITNWSRSQIYMAGSEIVALGYSYQKSYGISLSAGPEKLESTTMHAAKRPEGIITENSFDNAYYGFYSYEADNVALIGNEYKENVVYGIDPHDRSHFLTIAYNTAYQAEKKHGIIISREVNDSSYIGNLSFDNKGSGFMIDRLSTGTYVYGNTAFDNKQDGLTLFESSCNLIASNHFYDNKRDGLRVRNSQDNGIFYNYLHHNKRDGVIAYSARLEGEPAHRNRDFVLDPYSNITAMTLVGNHVEANRSGIVAESLAALSLKGNQMINQSPKAYLIDWFQTRPYLASQYDRGIDGMVIVDGCRKGNWIKHHCRFNDQAVFSGDGQRHLQQTLTSRTGCNEEAS